MSTPRCYTRYGGKVPCWRDADYYIEIYCEAGHRGQGPVCWACARRITDEAPPHGGKCQNAIILVDIVPITSRPGP